METDDTLASGHTGFKRTGRRGFQEPGAVQEEDAVMIGRRHHDMGGLEAGPVDREEHDKAPWEKRVDALVVLLGQRKIIGVDELRRGIEELGADAYDRYGYYERWMASVTNILLEKKIIEVGELGARMAEIEAGERHELP